MNYQNHLGIVALSKPFPSMATTTTLTEATFESKDGSTYVSKVARFSYAEVSLHRTQMDKRETLSLWLMEGRYVGLSSLLFFGTKSAARIHAA